METCFRCTLSKIMKYHVLVHNYAPFRGWPLINIDNDGFPEEPNPEQELILPDDKHEHTELYLTANLENARKLSDYKPWTHPWNLLQRQLLRDARLGTLQINNTDFSNSMYTSAWRRVFADNFIDFSCTDTDIAAYIREQKEESRPIHVFKEISKREMGGTFDHFRVLESIASPYYYVLPHHREPNLDEMRDIVTNWMLRSLDDPPHENVISRFESRFRIARRNMARFD
ncbi:uncharacterized protein TNIN_438421 [Trichonephila inaurata madagascariensis]|uniref:Uncharacterized protein n=1 Tax=Trichonephila inaurata madagascariensis TaxID=2747483 RepID=A0A8X6WTK5_9ARAC|nr:uncharacterized protein TNIN_438421 [Trichonephila inaurata madagascariensis]